ncbi:histidine kinase [Balamuthia mandrillaris]
MSEVTVESRGSSHNEGWQNLTEGGRWKSRSWTVKEQEAFASSTAAMLLQGRMRFSASISPSSGCPYCGCSCSAGMMTMFKNISSSSSSSSSSVASSASSLSTSVNNRTSFRPASGSFIPLGTNGWREGTKQQQTVVEETREEEEDQGKQEDEEKEDYIVPVAESQKEAQPQPGRKKGKRKRRNSSVSGSSSPSSPLTSKRDNHNSFWGRLRANTMNNSAGTEKAKGEKEKKKKAKKNKAASKKEKGSEQLAKLLDEIEEAPSSPALPRSSSSLPTSSKEKLSQQQKSAKQTEEGLKEKTWGKPVDLASLDVLNKLKHPIWIFDPDNVRMHWANHAALQLWNSPSLEELLSRDYEEDMSVATKTRIHHRREQLFSSPSESFTERWTFYPLKQPRPVRVTGSAVLVNEVHPAILAKEKKEAEKNKQEQKTERNRDNKKEQKVPKWRVSLGSTIRNKHKKQHKEESTTIREPWLAMMVEGDVDRNVDQQTLRAVEAMTHTLSMISLYRMSDLKPLYLNPAALVVHSPFLTASIPSSASSSSSSSPAASLSSSSSYVHSNQSSSLVTKLSGEEGKEQLELFTFQDRFFHAQDFEDCMQALNEGKVFDREVLMRTPSFNTVVSNDTTSNNNNNNNNSSDNVNANGHWHSLYARCTIDPATGEKAILVDEADISRRKLIEKSNSEKDSFLNMVSHEIRTPINGIIGFNSLLLETELNAEQREYVQSIQQSSKLLLAQVNDLLDIAKITEGKLLLDVVLVHFPTILSHILSLAEPLLENKFQNQKRINWNNCCSASSTHPSPSHPSRSSSPNSSSALHHSLEDLHHLHQQNEKSLRQRFKITAEIAEDVPHVLFGDPLRITQILMNFVSNAIKFTDIPDDSPDSFARVHIVISLLKKERSSSSCSTSSTLTSVTPQQKEKGDAENKTKTSEEREREEREEGVMLQMSVEDNGIGVPEDKKKYIFSSFMQADSSISRKYGGTGLGLSISKRLAQLMGGDCSFTSKVGVGSTFTATVHLQQRYQPPKLIASSSSTITTATPSTKKAEAQETLMHENSSYLFVINECDILCPSRSLSSSSSSSSSQQQESCPYRNGSQKLLCETVKRCGGWKVQVMDSWQQLRKTVLELDTGTTRIILAICNDRGHIFSRSFFSPSSSSAFPSTSTTLFEPLHQLGQQAPNDEKDYEAKEMEEIEEDRKEAEPEMYSCTLNVGGLMEEAREEGWLLGVEVWELNQDTESVLDFLNQTVFNTLEANTSQRSRSNVMKQIGSALGSSSSSIPASSTPKNIASSAAAKTTLSSVTEEEKRTNREEDKERETRAKAESGEEENNTTVAVFTGNFEGKNEQKERCQCFTTT